MATDAAGVGKGGKPGVIGFEDVYAEEPVSPLTVASDREVCVWGAVQGRGDAVVVACWPAPRRWRVWLHAKVQLHVI
jgi:hypothetical protein